MPRDPYSPPTRNNWKVETGVRGGRHEPQCHCPNVFGRRGFNRVSGCHAITVQPHCMPKVPHLHTSPCQSAMLLRPCGLSFAVLAAQSGRLADRASCCAARLRAKSVLLHRQPYAALQARIPTGRHLNATAAGERGVCHRVGAHLAGSGRSGPRSNDWGLIGCPPVPILLMRPRRNVVCLSYTCAVIFPRIQATALICR